MKLSGIENLNPGVRSFILISVALAYPAWDFVRMRKKRPGIGMILVVLFMGTAGYIAGSNHTYLLTCDDFEISGSFVPTDCRPRMEPR